MTTWIAPQAHRVTEPQTGPERPMLQGWLEWHRQTLLSKCAGLTADQLKLAAVKPSNLSLLGLVRHMTEVERGWLLRGAAGNETATLIYCSDDNPDGDFDDGADADPDEAFARFAEQRAACDHAVADLPLDHEFDRGRTISLRWVYLHLIEEYARHNGHADLLRERLDGTTGD